MHELHHISAVALLTGNKRLRTTSAGVGSTMNMLKLSDFIGNTLVVSLAEDRILIGSLVAVDAQMNLLLDHAEERIGPRSRMMGLVSVPRHSVQSIKVTKPVMQELTAKRVELMANIV